MLPGAIPRAFHDSGAGPAAADVMANRASMAAARAPEMTGAWSGLDFRLLAPLPGFVARDGATVMLVLGLGEAGPGDLDAAAEKARRQALEQLSKLPPGTPPGFIADHPAAEDDLVAADLADLHELAGRHAAGLAAAAAQVRANALARARWEAGRPPAPAAERLLAPRSFAHGPHNRAVPLPPAAANREGKR
jgi:hypothetical protein